MVQLYLLQSSNMSKFLFLPILLISTFCLAQSNAELDKRNGFKDIKLLTNATALSTLAYAQEIKDQPFTAVYKPVNGAYPNIGEVAIKEIEVLTYKNLIYQITITTEKDPQLFKGLEKAFGKARHSVVDNYYYWQGSIVRLSFLSVGKKKVQFTYYAPGIKDIRKADAVKKVEDLSSEF